MNEDLALCDGWGQVLPKGAMCSRFLFCSFKTHSPLAQGQRRRWLCGACVWPRPTQRRLSPGLTTTNATRHAPGPHRLYADGRLVWKLGWCRQTRFVAKPRLHRPEAGRGRCFRLGCSAGSCQTLAPSAQGRRGPMCLCLLCCSFQTNSPLAQGPAGSSAAWCLRLAQTAPAPASAEPRFGN